VTGGGGGGSSAPLGARTTSFHRRAAAEMASENAKLNSQVRELRVQLEGVQAIRVLRLQQQKMQC
jgi:hypothetical protein